MSKLKEKGNVKNIKKHFSHETRKTLINKFLIVFSIIFFYFIFVSWHLGFKNGFHVTILTWTFFVLATPIPDGGIILDLPLRYFLGIKMITSEIFVWIFAILANVVSLMFYPSVYDSTVILTLFKEILITPIPYWSIIILSGIGTFLTLYFGDELYDVLKHSKRHKYHKHKHKLKIITIIAIIIFVIIVYDLLITNLGIHLL